MTVIATGCKINLGLRITGKLANGFHTLESIVYPLAWPRDELRIERTGGAALELLCPGLNARSNTIYRAWELFSAATGQRPGLRARLTKRVPIGAGLGGGSANGAAMLNFLNGACGQPLPRERLLALAARLGADVPFFLQNRPCAMSGVGEILRPVAFDARGHWLVLAFPGFASDTARAYAAFDENCAHENKRGESCNPGAKGGTPQESLTKGHCSDTSPVSAGGCAGASPLVCGAFDLRNDLEAAVFAGFPILGELKRELLALGASQAAMSGSGSSVYGIFASGESARYAAQTLRQKLPRVYRMPLNNF